MYTVSATYNTILADDLHWYETQVKINDIVYAQSQIMEMSVSYREFTEEYPVAGGCLSAELSLKMLTPSVQIPRMAKVEPFARITNGTLTSEWIPQGVFDIDTREQSQNDDNLPVMSIHCYDSMLKAEADYPETTHAWPYTDIDVVNEIATAMGVSVDARTTALMTHGYSISLPAGYTMRETLGYIAAMYAGNFVMTYDGELLLIGLNSLPPETNYLVDNAGFAITFGRGETEETISGPIVTFNGDGSPLLGLSVAIEPVQNLNGYDNPWPAGGGKNLLPKGENRASAGITFSVQDNGEVVVTGTAERTTFWAVQFTIPAGSYILSGCPSGGGASTYYIDVRNAQGGAGISGIAADAGSGSAFTISESLTAYVNIRIASGYAAPSGGLKISPMIRLSSVSDATYAPYSNICPISGWTEAKVWREATYDPTTNPSLTIDLDGTRYGGTLDVLTGVLTVTKVIRQITSSNSFASLTGTNYYQFTYYFDQNSYANGASKNAMCNLFPKITLLQRGTVSGLVAYDGDRGYRFSLNSDFGITTTDQFKAFITDNPLYVTAELATPLTVQLTPATLSTLVGENNVWADTGDVEVSYSYGGEVTRILV